MIENCPMRHENGNCIPAGGFCTANKNICEALLNAYRMGKAQLSKESTTSDLISRTETVEHLRRMLEATVPNTDYDEGYVDGVQFAISTVSTMPTIQPEPKEGQWILHESPDGGVQYECSECGVLWEFTYGTPEDNEAYFCPKCGKKMKGERQK